MNLVANLDTKEEFENPNEIKVIMDKNKDNCALVVNLMQRSN